MMTNKPDAKSTISEDNLARFEAIGLEGIRRDLAIGGVTYLGIGDVRNQARLWVKNKQSELELERETARKLGTARFKTLRLWTIIAAIASVVAAIAGLINVFK